MTKKELKQIIKEVLSESKYKFSVGYKIITNYTDDIKKIAKQKHITTDKNFWNTIDADYYKIDHNIQQYLKQYGTLSDTDTDGNDNLIGTLFTNNMKFFKSIEKIVDGDDKPLSTITGSLDKKMTHKGTSEFGYLIDVTLDFDNIEEY